MGSPPPINMILLAKLACFSAILLVSHAAQDSWEETAEAKNYISLHSPLIAIQQSSEGKTKLALDQEKFDAIHNQIKGGTKHIRLVNTGMKNMELEVSPFEVFTKDAVVESEDGPMARPAMIHLRGKVAGQDNSFVTLSMGKHGAYGVVQAGTGHYQLSVPTDRSAHAILMEVKKGSKETAKETEIDKEEAVDEELSQPITLVGEPTTLVQTKARATTDNYDATGTQPVLSVAIECDKACRDLFQASGSCLAEFPTTLVVKDENLISTDSWAEAETAPFASDQSTSCAGWVSAGYSCDTTTITVTSGSTQTAYTLNEYCPTSCGVDVPTAAPTPMPTYAEGDGVAGCTHPAATYIATLIAATSSIYSNDVGVTLQISYMKVWSGTTDYDSGTASLGAFKDAYTGVEGTEKDADIAHLFTGIVEGGLAYVGTACNNQGYNTGVSSIRGTWQGSLEANAYNWDVIVTAHEMGHNVGSGHTHDVSSYSPTIDSCISSSGATAAYGSDECERGTIMSYCHLCGGTANIDMNLDDRVKETIKTSLSGSCNLDL